MIRLDEPSPGSEPEFDPKSIMRFLERSQRGESAADKAQDLFYEAMDASSDEAEFALLEQALGLDPGNVDARLAMMQRHLPPLPPEQEVEALKNIVRLGEKSLGKKAFEEYAGGFWGFIETRPYMRARAQLALAFYQAGRVEEAMSEWEGMLELNPNDNQGMRYRLLALYLSLGRLKEARGLFKKFPEANFSAVFAWGKVLERFLSGKLEAAATAAAAAHEQNGYAKAYILGHRRIPKNMPEAYSPGSKEEAACYAEDLRLAWEPHREAMAWLAGWSGKAGETIHER